MRIRRWNKDPSLLKQALFSNFILGGASVVLLTALFVLAQLSAAGRQMGLRAEVLADFVATQSEFAMLVGDRTELERIAHNALNVEDVLFVVMTGTAGDSICLSQPGFPVEKICRISATGRNSGPTLHTDGARRFSEVIRSVSSQTASSVVEWESAKTPAKQIGAIQIGVSMDQQDRLLRRGLWLEILSALSSFILILAFQYAQLRRLLEPLKGLIAFTRQVGQGDLSRRAPVGRLDEVGRLAKAFNRMVEELGSTTVSKNYIDNIIRSMGEALIVTGPDRTIRTVNQEALTMLGYSEEELLGQPTALVLSANGSDAEIAGSTGAELEYRTKSGARIPVLFSASPMRGEDGRDAGQVWLAQDITARKVVEAQLREAKQQAEAANQAKSEFLSRTSHELRTPLNAILGFGQLLEIVDLEEDDRESLEQIMKAGRHLLCLINEVLDIAGIESGRRSLSREPVRIGDVARDALDMTRGLALARSIEIRTELGLQEDDYVVADRQRLQQVLLNLLSNAVKYNRAGGTVTLTCEDRTEGEVRISVRDTGLGIPPEDLAKLFVPFERLGAAEAGIEGTGLGLASSRIFVEAMNAVMGVDSVVGEGSVFWLDLQRAAAPLEELERVPEAGIASRAVDEGHKGIVLYIEDNLTNLKLVKRVLARYPQIEFLSASRGEDGVRLAREAHPDLILLDLHLPDFWGDEVLRRLREDPITREIPVVMLSADATQHQIDRLLAAGAYSYMTKPIDCQRLIEMVDEVFSETLANA
ncbi:MAG: ATP-binding protein [Bryobacteraceae bacterium]|jgi:PAS domain S-box-containing protein